MHHDKAKTPPTLPELPPTPPPTGDRPPIPHVAQLVAFYEECRAGRAPRARRQFNLSSYEFDQLEAHLAQRPSLQGYVNDKIRYNYDAVRERFSIRMPSKEHDLLAQEVADFIKSQLSAWAEQKDSLGAWAARIKSTSTTDIPLRLTEVGDTRSSRSPDASFTHVEAKYPGLVIEVSYSQRFRDLANVAEDYILGTEGNIRTVIGLDLAYKERGKPLGRHDKSAKFSVWRSSFTLNAANDVEELTSELILSKEFRDGDGNAVNGADLILEPADFTIPELSPEPFPIGSISSTTIPDQSRRNITLSSYQLCTVLDGIDNLPASTTTGKCRRAPSGTLLVKRKRRRSSTTSLPASNGEVEAELVDRDEGGASGSVGGHQDVITDLADPDYSPHARPQRRATKMPRRTR